MPTPRPGRRVRGSRSGRPIMAALDLLGRRWALRILWELRDGRAAVPRAARGGRRRVARRAQHAPRRAARGGPGREHGTRATRPPPPAASCAARSSRSRAGRSAGRAGSVETGALVAARAAAAAASPGAGRAARRRRSGDSRARRRRAPRAAAARRGSCRRGRRNRPGTSSDRPNTAPSTSTYFGVAMLPSSTISVSGGSRVAQCVARRRAAARHSGGLRCRSATRRTRARRAIVIAVSGGHEPAARRDHEHAGTPVGGAAKRCA